ncbi:MAG: 5-formyltetrahydrofolate cyclo-ligase [Anaerosomatales bacterium]
MTGEHAEAKHAARSDGRAARQGIPSGERQARASAAAERVLGLPEIAAARTVLAYSATREEIDPAPVLAALRRRGVVVVLPRVSGPGQLTLHRVDDAADLVEGPFGLLEPAEGAPAVAPADVDVAIVPGVAFDGACRRVGHGGGYYDRLLGAMTHAVTVGLAFDEQVFSEVPSEPHDMCVDVLVTPTRTFRRARP